MRRFLDRRCARPERGQPCPRACDRIYFGGQGCPRSCSERGLDAEGNPPPYVGGYGFLRTVVLLSPDIVPGAGILVGHGDVIFAKLCAAISESEPLCLAW